jgi:hypothetical protein
MTEHDQLENSIAAYMLGAADPQETETVHAHLAACAACRELSQRLARAAGALALTADEVRPPERLRQKILAAAAASPGAATPPPNSRALRIRVPPARRILGPLWTPAYAAIAVLTLAVAGLGAWNLAMTRQLDEQRTSVARYSMTGSGDMAGARASAVSLRGDGLTVVEFQHVPDPPAGKVYELWLGRDGRMEAAGVFLPDKDGSKVLVLDRSLRGYSVIALTVENGPDGAASPTQSPTMVRQLA